MKERVDLCDLNSDSVVWLRLKRISNKHARTQSCRRVGKAATTIGGMKPVAVVEDVSKECDRIWDEDRDEHRLKDGLIRFGLLIEPSYILCIRCSLHSVWPMPGSHPD